MLRTLRFAGGTLTFYHTKNMSFLRSKRTGTGKKNNTDTSNGGDAASIHSDTDIAIDGDISSSEYARKRKELMELAKDLRALG